jgi:hypothetical protein
MIIAMNVLFIWSFTLPEDSRTGGDIGLVAATLVIILTDLFMGSMIIKNYVLLDSEKLTIYVGVIKQEIPYKHIISLKKTHNPLSSMGLSLDRLEIKWNNRFVLISVKDNDALIHKLCELNPKIKVIQRGNYDRA